MPRVLLPTADPALDAALALPQVGTAVLEQQAYVYLHLDTIPFPIANIPIVLFPDAEPKDPANLDTATPQAVLAQVAYVYLFLIQEATVVVPNANIPLVLFPAAELLLFATLAAPTPQAVLVQDEYVYLFLTVDDTVGELS